MNIKTPINYPVGLIHLEMGNNKHYELPNNIGQLIRLELLNASNNEIEVLHTDIPDFESDELMIQRTGIQYLASLVDLNLSSNKIKFLPLEMVNLTNLRKLNVRKNPGIVIPEEIKQMPNLAIEYDSD